MSEITRSWGLIPHGSQRAIPAASGVALVMTTALLRRTAGGRRRFVQGRNSKAAVEGSRAKWADHRLKKDAPVGPALAFDEDHHTDFDYNVQHDHSVKSPIHPSHNIPVRLEPFCSVLFMPGGFFYWPRPGGDILSAVIRSSLPVSENRRSNAPTCVLHGKQRLRWHWPGVPLQESDEQPGNFAILYPTVAYSRSRTKPHACRLGRCVARIDPSLRTHGRVVRTSRLHIVQRRSGFDVAGDG